MLSIIIPSATELMIHWMEIKTRDEFPEAEILIAHDPKRKGKGRAIRCGLGCAQGDIICFIDGDLDIHPKMIKRLLPHLDEFDIVVGKKDTRAMISRWILTCLSRIYISLMFGIPVDTQTGVKVFKRSALPDWEADDFSFDIEILAKAKKAGASMFEVTVDTVRSRRMDLRSVFVALWGSFKIWKRLQRGRHGKKNRGCAGAVSGPAKKTQENSSKERVETIVHRYLQSSAGRRMA